MSPSVWTAGRLKTSGVEILMSEICPRLRSEFHFRIVILISNRRTNCDLIWQMKPYIIVCIFCFFIWRTEKGGSYECSDQIPGSSASKSFIFWKAYLRLCRPTIDQADWNRLSLWKSAIWQYTIGYTVLIEIRHTCKCLLKITWRYNDSSPQQWPHLEVSLGWRYGLHLISLSPSFRDVDCDVIIAGDYRETSWIWYRRPGQEKISRSERPHNRTINMDHPQASETAGRKGVVRLRQQNDTSR